MGDEDSGSGRPGPALRLGVLAAAGIMEPISRQIQQDTRDIEERQQNQAVEPLPEDVQDPCGGGLAGGGRRLPGYEEMCAPLERADLPVEADMRFARVPAGGREVWRLTALRACPAPDDFDLPSELSVLGRLRFSPQESAFLFVSDFCAPASESASETAKVE